ncbi:hypothetical protein H4217_004694 [Coemansia sp. RSA 1939]|nr:hypothetical protein H4217_004694 [Coemansia sp. RSA 1939]KAJ2609427.1 hypothetical protein EV177_004468 [Coemansia sp. RSA 1804]
MAKQPPTDQKAKPSSASSSARGRNPATPARAADSYPWRRVLFGCLVVLVCWGIGIQREYPEAVNTRLKVAQDWVFSRLWTQLSAHSNARIHPLRKPLWAQVRGGSSVLELGPGYGDALAQLTAAPARYVALEPNPYLHPKLAENARANGFAVQYDNEAREEKQSKNRDHAKEDTKKEMPAFVIVNGTLDGGAQGMIPKYVTDHAPYDYVVTSLVLCSVDSVQANLDAIQALLKPGGKYIFVEHVRHSHAHKQQQPGDGLDVAKWARIQSLVSRVAWPFTGNCHFDRNTGDMLKAMGGWSSVDYKTSVKADSLEAKMTPLIYGTATKK